MTCDGGTAEGALIARRRDHDHTAPDSVIEGLVECLFPLCGRVCKAKAQVNDSRTGVDRPDIGADEVP